MLFEQDHITQIKIQEDRLGLLVMTRSRREFSRALTRISLNGHTVESIVAADKNMDRCTNTCLEATVEHSASPESGLDHRASAVTPRVSFQAELLGLTSGSFSLDHFRRPPYRRKNQEAVLAD